MDERTLRRYRSVVHPLVSIAVPFVFLLALDHLMRALFFGTLLPPESPLFPVLLAAAGASEVLTANMLLKRRVGGILPRLRELLLVLIAGYGLLVLVHGDFRSPAAAFGSFSVIYGTALILAGWLLTAAIHASLRRREFFYGLILGRQGADLRNTMRDCHDEAGGAEEGVRKVRRMLVLLQVVIAALLAAYLVAVTPVSPWLVALALAHEVVAFVAWAFMNHLLEEQAFLGNGPAGDLAALDRRWRRGLFASVALAAVLALAFTGRRPAVPPELTAGLLDRIGAWFNERLMRNYRPATAQPTESTTTQEMDLGISRSPLFAMDQASGQGSRIIRIIAIAVLGSAGALIVFFLVKPLFSRETQAALRHAHPLRAAAAKVRAAWRGLAEAWAGFVRWLRTPKGTIRRVAATILGGLRATASQLREAAAREESADRERRRQLSRTLREFLRLVRWGEQAGVPYRRSMGPLEYATELGRTAADQQGALLEAALAFEEILYSQHEIGEHRLGELYRAVTAIVRQRLERR